MNNGTWIRETRTWLSARETLVVATFLLVLITFFYLLETKKSRAALGRTIAVDTQPKVFIKAIETAAQPDYNNNKIIIHSKLILSNCGRTEGKNIRFSYSITQENEVLKEGAFGPYQYLYPDQTANARIGNLSFPIGQNEMKIVRQAYEQNKPILFTGSLQKPVMLKINLDYEDMSGQKTTVPYTFRYFFAMNSWVYPSEKTEPQAPEATKDKQEQ